MSPRVTFLFFVKGDSHYPGLGLNPKAPRAEDWGVLWFLFSAAVGFVLGRLAFCLLFFSPGASHPCF